MNGAGKECDSPCLGETNGTASKSQESCVREEKRSNAGNDGTWEMKAQRLGVEHLTCLGLV